MEGSGLRCPEINTERGGVTGLSQKWERNQKVILMGGTIQRKRLSDITNTVSSGRSRGGGAASDSSIQEIPKVVPCPGAKDYITQLMEENTALLKLVGDRNKIIEATAIELQKLKFQLQRANQQNWQLAQANSQMQAELNLGRDRLKKLQHELGCANAVLKLKALEMEEKEKLYKDLCEKTGSEERQPKHAEVAEEASHPADSDNTYNPNRKRTSRHQSLRSSMATHQIQVERRDKRRKSSRRRSNDLKSESCEPINDSFEEDAKLQVHSPISEPLNEDPPIQPDSSAPSCLNVVVEQGKNEEHKTQSGSSQSCDQQLRRSSVGRPTRKAAEKVTSYKEMSLVVKMRRSE